MIGNASIIYFLLPPKYKAHPKHGAALLRLGGLRARPPPAVAHLRDHGEAVRLLKDAGDAMPALKKGKHYWQELGKCCVLMASARVHVHVMSCGSVWRVCGEEVPFNLRISRYSRSWNFLVRTTVTHLHDLTIE